MANINLREYFREIDGMIGAGQFAQAIEHCKYLLMIYPKNFEAYRLLGKASLENKDLPQATDAFERALAVQPDDFIANVGMSCIREEEGNLDAAIWHMERSFEMNSSTPAIQGELKRLYALRDGESPQKIRLTKGALIRLHAQSGMLQQAISEIQTMVPPNEERPDIEVLLADLYYQNGQKDAAAEVCRGLIKALPYCFTANFILLNTPASGADDVESSIYRDRLVELDPYFAFVQETSQSAISVANDAVIVRKYDPDQPAPVEDISASLPVQPSPGNQTDAAAAESEKETVMPAWFSEESLTLQEFPAEPFETPPIEPETPLEEEGPSPVVSQNGTSMIHGEASVVDSPLPSVEPDVPSGQETEAPAPEAQASVPDLPDWMKNEDWKPETPMPDLNAHESEPASGEPASGVPSPIESAAGEPQAGKNVLPADIPEWVKGMAPVDADVTGLDASDLSEKTDLSQILFTDLDDNDVAFRDVLAEDSPTRGVEEAGEIPTARAPAEDNASIPDWLQGFDPSLSKPTEKSAEKTSDNSLPDWLGADLGTSSSESKPFTLEGFSDLNLDQAKPEPGDEEEFPGTAPLPEENVREFEKPEWLKEETHAGNDIEALFSEPEKPAQPADDFSSWLENLRPEASMEAGEETRAPAGSTTPEDSANNQSELPAWMSEPEPPVQMGDTEPVGVKKTPETFQPENPRMDAWMSEATSSAAGPQDFELPETPASAEMSTMPDFFAPEEQAKDTEPIAEEPHAPEPIPASEPAASAVPVESPAPREKESIASLIEYYNHQLGQGKNLPTVIDELKKLTGEHPAEPGIWLILGDAYHQNKQIQAALDAYARAEESLS